MHKQCLHDTNLRSDSITFLDYVCACLSNTQQASEKNFQSWCISVCVRNTLSKFSLVQSEHIVRIIDSKIIDDCADPAVCILMELGEMDFDKYLQSPASAPQGEGTMPHCQGQGCHGGGNSG